MQLSAIMDGLGTALSSIAGLRVTPYWSDRITPPAAVVAWPDQYEFDTTMGRGSDHVVVPVVVIVGRADARSSRDRLAGYADGSGPQSVKAAVEAYHPPTTVWDTVTVRSVEFGSVEVAGVPYIAATFSIGITGRGA